MEEPQGQDAPLARRQLDWQRRRLASAVVLIGAKAVFLLTQDVQLPASLFTRETDLAGKAARPSPERRTTSRR